MRRPLAGAPNPASVRKTFVATPHPCAPSRPPEADAAVVSRPRGAWPVRVVQWLLPQPGDRVRPDDRPHGTRDAGTRSRPAPALFCLRRPRHRDSARLVEGITRGDLAAYLRPRRYRNVRHVCLPGAHWTRTTAERNRGADQNGAVEKMRLGTAPRRGWARARPKLISSGPSLSRHAERIAAPGPAARKVTPAPEHRARRPWRPLVGPARRSALIRTAVSRPGSPGIGGNRRFGRR